MKSLSNSANIAGIKIGVSAAGIRYQDRDDVVIFEFCEGTSTAATFTKNRFAAAPVIVAKENLAKVNTRYLVINAGYLFFRKTPIVVLLIGS